MLDVKKIKKYLPFKKYLGGYYKKIDFIFLNKTALRPHEVKDFEFWIYLGRLLINLNPSTILELGSGKSSLLFSDFAYKRENTIFESIEQNYFYARKIKKALKNSFLPDNYIKHVSLIDGWYDVKKIRDIKYDFIFVDGPTTGIFSNNPRSNKIAVQFLKKYVNSCKVIIFDDSQRLSEQKLIKDLNFDDSVFNYIDINCYKFYPQTRMRIYYRLNLESIVKNNANLVN